MMLSDEDMKRRRLISNEIESHYRPASYDVSVGTILKVDGSEVSEHKLEPQGVVEIVSREEVNLPQDVVGYAMVKTSLCNEGILPLNIGIIDPGWKGPVSATLLNFGKKDYFLTADEVFLRLTFHRISLSDRKESPRGISRDDYMKERKKKVINFAETFLNLDATIEKAMTPFLSNLKKNALIWVPLLAVFFTVLAFAVTLGVNYTNRGYWSKEDVKSEIKEELGLTKEGGLDSRLKTLESEIKTLRANQPQKSPTP
jgi:deoxycytidine triphosphate deaminase